jgi:hypothetical protein
MRFIKVFKHAAIAAVVVMALEGASASATTITSPSGTQYSGFVSASLKFGTEATLKSSFIGEVKCKESTFEGFIQSQGAEVTAGVSSSSGSIGSCNGSVTFPKGGTLEVHTEGGSSNGNGTLTSSGAEVTIELSGIHCIFTTSNTNLGTVTGGSPATFAAKSAAIPRTGGRSGGFCGSSATWTANYTVTTPSTLLID